MSYRISRQRRFGENEFMNTSGNDHGNFCPMVPDSEQNRILTS